MPSPSQISILDAFQVCRPIKLYSLEWLFATPDAFFDSPPLRVGDLLSRFGIFVLF